MNLQITFVAEKPEELVEAALLDDMVSFSYRHDAKLRETLNAVLARLKEYLLEVRATPPTDPEALAELEKYAGRYEGLLK